MARVVQRRGTPPYLLILFVFLFLISTVLAVLFYMRDAEKATALAERDQDLIKLQQDLRLKEKDISRLIEKITGLEGQDAKAALQEADASLQGTHAQEYANTGLASAITGLDNKIATLNETIDKLKTSQVRLSDRISKNREAASQVQANLAKELEAAKKALTQAQVRHQQQLRAKDAQRAQAEAAKDKIITEKDQRIAVLVQEKSGQGEKIQQQDARIKQLLGIIRELKGKGSRVGELVLRQADGKVAKVLLDQPICYIDLGEKDRVTPGLSFSVYSAQTGIPEDGTPKAKILVVNVGPTTSECRILESDRNDPIMEGDLIANVVFHPNRTYKFVVEGEFDLYGTGRPDPLANRNVRALIESFGGKISETVSVDTDFVVMGEEPPRPPRPAEDAPPAVWQVYNEKMKKYGHFKEVQATAVSLQVPVLNTSRFLAFSGYVPKKRLAE